MTDAASSDGELRRRDRSARMGLADAFVDGDGVGFGRGIVIVELGRLPRLDGMMNRSWMRLRIRDLRLVEASSWEGGLLV